MHLNIGADSSLKRASGVPVSLYLILRMRWLMTLSLFMLLLRCRRWSQQFWTKLLLQIHVLSIFERYTKLNEPKSVRLKLPFKVIFLKISFVSIFKLRNRHLCLSLNRTERLHCAYFLFSHRHG